MFSSQSELFPHHRFIHGSQGNVLIAIQSPSWSINWIQSLSPLPSQLGFLSFSESLILLRIYRNLSILRALIKTLSFNDAERRKFLTVIERVRPQYSPKEPSDEYCYFISLSLQKAGIRFWLTLHGVFLRFNVTPSCWSLGCSFQTIPLPQRS